MKTTQKMVWSIMCGSRDADGETSAVLVFRIDALVRRDHPTLRKTITEEQSDPVEEVICTRYTPEGLSAFAARCQHLITTHRAVRRKRHE